MDNEQYDSAQIWLNKIHEKIPVKTFSINNYFLLTRQAEVYYYNNLQQLGLQESLRGLEIAKSLSDSLLLADSYNFLGLFYMNMDSVSSSLQYYKKGILYTRQPPYPYKYLSLTKPHHLYGNLSEAYFKLKKYDSALFNNTISMQKAKQIQWQRGIAVAYTSMGNIYLALRNLDSAYYYFQNGKDISKNAKEIDVELLCYSGLGQYYEIQNNYAKAKEQLFKGFTLLNEKQIINKFFALQFLNNGIEIFKNNKDNSALVNALELKSTIETANVKGSNAQIQTILNAGLTNEKRILNLEIDEVKQKQKLANTRLLMALAAIGLLILLFLLYRYNQNQKTSISKMRQKISQDLHDDIGASLSSLQIYGAVAEKTFIANPEKAIEMLHKIAEQSKTVMENMNDIVWSMNVSDANIIPLESKVKNYSVELLSENEIDFSCIIQNDVETSLKNITAKRNILLIIREAMNNIAKYSKSTQASLHINIVEKHLLLVIKDNGLGFDVVNGAKGNGLYNMKQRVKELNGNFDIISKKNEGTKINIKIPLKSI